VTSDAVMVKRVSVDQSGATESEIVLMAAMKQTVVRVVLFSNSGRLQLVFIRVHCKCCRVCW